LNERLPSTSTTTTSPLRGLSERSTTAMSPSCNFVTIGLPIPIPILAQAVRAGFPSPADDFIEDEIDLHRLIGSYKRPSSAYRLAAPSYRLSVDGCGQLEPCPVT
jgi:hypothetical protein